MWYDEHQVTLWKAGEVAPAGIYLRVDDESYRVVILENEERLPVTFDGHVAMYCVASTTFVPKDYANHQWAIS